MYLILLDKSRDTVRVRGGFPPDTVTKTIKRNTKVETLDLPWGYCSTKYFFYTVKRTRVGELFHIKEKNHGSE